MKDEGIFYSAESIAQILKEAEVRMGIERERSLSSAKMASLGEMAGCVALAILTLLAGQCADLLNDTKPNVEQLKKHVANIEITTKKVAKIVCGLRRFSRDAKNDPSVITKVADIIEETLAFTKQKMTLSGIRLAVVHADPDLSISCREIEISQVILNLLNNSQQAINACQDKWIMIETKAVDNDIEIYVTDSGSGIPEESRDKLFSPFFTTKEAGKGTGLGLSISKRILESHGGSIFVDYAHPHTRFVMRLPK